MFSKFHNDTSCIYDNVQKVIYTGCYLPVRYPKMWHAGLSLDLNHLQHLVNFCFPNKNEVEIPQLEHLDKKNECK